MKKGGLNQRKKMDEYSAESPFPNTSQELLLKTALAPPEQSLGYWKKWKAIHDFETDVDSGSYRLLPLVYHRLKELNYTDDLSNRLKGAYRKSWAENHQLFYKTSKVLKLLRENNIQTIVLKGISLTVSVYENYGIRPMYDIDILVSKGDVRHAVKLLEQSGFAIKQVHRFGMMLKYNHSITLADETGTELDLHWYPFPESRQHKKNSEFWKYAIPIEIGGVETQAFSYTDALFHVTLHGMRKNPEPPVRWVADAIFILKIHSGKIDWDRFIDMAHGYKVLLPIRSSLSYLKEEFDADIENAAIEKLWKEKPTQVERIIFWHAKKIGTDIEGLSFPLKFFSLYVAYLRQSHSTNFMLTQMGFPRFLAHRIKAQINSLKFRKFQQPDEVSDRKKQFH